VSVGAVIGIVGALILIPVGLILSVISYFNQINLHNLEIMLFLGASALIAGGAHMLDKSEAEKKAEKAACCKQNGFLISENKDYVWVSQKNN
jgi:hypothetical protein